jgi:hypothetical protein
MAAQHGCESKVHKQVCRCVQVVVVVVVVLLLLLVVAQLPWLPRSDSQDG